MDMSYLLSPGALKSGFTLEEVNDHTLELRLDGESVAVFSSYAAAVSDINRTARRILYEKYGEELGFLAGLTADTGKV